MNGHERISVMTDKKPLFERIKNRFRGAEGTNRGIGGDVAYDNILYVSCSICGSKAAHLK